MAMNFYSNRKDCQAGSKTTASSFDAMMLIIVGAIVMVASIFLCVHLHLAVIISIVLLLVLLVIRKNMVNTVSLKFNE